MSRGCRIDTRNRFADQLPPSSIEMAGDGRCGQHDEIMGCQDWKMLEDVGLPDGSQEGSVEVSNVLKC